MWGDKIPLNRLKEKLTKENMWLYVLALLKERPRYPYEIADKIEKRFGWRPARVTAYIVLRSLRSKGYVKMVKKRGDLGKMRNYFEITKKGEDSFERGLEFIRETYQKLSGRSIE